MQNVQQPPLRTDWLRPGQLTTPQVPQNLLRPTWKGYGTLGDCAGSWNSGYANCGCVGCGGGNVLTNALAGLGRTQMRRGSLGQLDEYSTPRWLQVTYGVASLVGGAAGAYHGYIRNNNSLGWGIGWFFLGSWFWPIAIPVAFAQGFAKPK